MNFVYFDDIAFLVVIRIFKMNTTLGTSANFLHFVLLATQRVDLAFRNHSTIADNPSELAFDHASLDHQTTSD